MKKFFNEFKEFISKGNVMSMAVGIIIGGAFTAIVTSLVNDIITPLIGVLLGGVNFTSIAVTIGEASIAFGTFIQAIINFLLTAFVLFLLVKAVNKMSRTKEDAPAPAEPSAEEMLLTEIRDLLKK